MSLMVGRALLSVKIFPKLMTEPIDMAVVNLYSRHTRTVEVIEMQAQPDSLPLQTPNESWSGQGELNPRLINPVASGSHSVVRGTTLISHPAQPRPNMDQVRRDAWAYLMQVSSDGYRKLTNADVLSEPNKGPMWDCLPLTRIANNYLQSYAAQRRPYARRLKAERTLTIAQTRALLNAALADYQNGAWDPEFATVPHASLGTGRDRDQ